MKNEVIIRFATPDDLPDIIDLCHQHALFERAEYDPAGKQEQLRAHLFSDEPTLMCLVAELEETVVGYATFLKQFSTWDADFYIYMDTLFLSEASRGHGIGERLMDRIKEEARKLNCSVIQWQTPEFNTRAMKFYNRIGAYSKTKERFFLDV